MSVELLRKTLNRKIWIKAQNASNLIWKYHLQSVGYIFRAKIYPKVAMFVYDLHDHKLWNTARWHEPSFDKDSDHRVIHLWSSLETLQHWAQRNINSMMAKYV